MPERKDYQDIKPGEGMRTAYAPKRTFQAPEPPPPLITKKWLCWRMDLVTLPGGVPKYKALYKRVLTPEVLEAIGTTEGEIRRAGFTTFSREQTVALVRILEL